MGGVIGAAFAAGSSYERLVEIALSLEKKDFAALDAWSLAKGVFAGNILKPEPLKRTIARLVPALRFADLKIPVTVTTTDLESGELVLFGPDPRPHPLTSSPLRGEGGVGGEVGLHDALCASCALPLYFPPAVIDGRRLGDGGLRAVLPLDVARRIPAALVDAGDGGPGVDQPPATKQGGAPPPAPGTRGALRGLDAGQNGTAIA